MRKEGTVIMSTQVQMEAVAAATETSLRLLREQEHSSCFACRPAKWGGLGLEFAVLPDGGLESWWTCPVAYQSYEGIVHGGILATVLDCAMLQVLFARGLVARTGELRLRYYHPVQVLYPLRVRAWMEEGKAPLHLLAAELWQDEQLCVKAQAKFMQTQEADCR